MLQSPEIKMGVQTIFFLFYVEMNQAFGFWNI